MSLSEGCWRSWLPGYGPPEEMGMTARGMGTEFQSLWMKTARYDDPGQFRRHARANPFCSRSGYVAEGV